MRPGPSKHEAHDIPPTQRCPLPSPCCQKGSQNRSSTYASSPPSGHPEWPPASPRGHPALALGLASSEGQTLFMPTKNVSPSRKRLVTFAGELGEAEGFRRGSPQIRTTSTAASTAPRPPLLPRLPTAVTLHALHSVPPQMFSQHLGQLLLQSESYVAQGTQPKWGQAL